MSDKEKQFSFDTDNLFRFIVKKQLPLLYVSLAALVVSLIISYLIPVEYKSTVILYPASPGSISQSLLSESFAEKELLKFGEQEQVEQMMQILQSSAIRDRIIEKYDLFKHYDIDKTGDYPITSLHRHYQKNVKVTRTEYMSVKIDVYDRNPVIAASIANDIAALYDSTVNNMQRERALKAFLLVENEYNNLKNRIQGIQDTLQKIHKLGIFEFESQSEVYNDQLAVALAQGNMRGVAEIEKRLEVLATYGSQYTKLRDQLQEEVKKLSKIEAKYAEAKIDLEQDLPHKYVVSKGEIPEKKAYPIRWLIVLVSTLSAFLFGLIVLLLTDGESKKKSQARSIRELALKVLSKTGNYEINYNVMEQYFRTQKLFELSLKWKWHLLIVAIAAAAIGTFISSPLIIKPKYKSVAVVYPANISTFSEESETEQMLEIIQSRDIRFRLFDAFNLAEHYGIDPKHPHFKTLMNNEFESNVTFQKTPNEAIEITVTDIDPQMASDMVDSILSFYTQKMLVLLRGKAAEILQLKQLSMNRKQHEIDSLTSTINEYRQKNNLLDYKTQVKVYSEAVSEGRSLDEARKVLDNWKQLGAEYQKTDSTLWYAINDLHRFKKEYDEAYMHATKEVTFAHVITHPYPADKKSYPVRWLIVLFSVLGALFASVLTISIIESRREKSRKSAV
ncbi:MAG TPA: Wzz/FepE/Etk N-terminal domain-containing protein [Bacteroidales bacterium]|nr:hypothetical protein [Bacteroidales bacterium]HOE04668.1 Wzz/FepE/Etk N-terminal domain-containing protein [Bacteroidales bacterium]